MRTKVYIKNKVNKLYQNGDKKKLNDVYLLICAYAVTILLTSIFLLAGTVGWYLSFVIISFFALFIITYSPSEKRAERALVLLWLFNLFFDIYFRFTRNVSVFELRYALDFGCVVILLFEVGNRVNRKFDSCIFLIICIAVIQTISSLLNLSPFTDYLYSLRMPIITIGFYLFARKNGIKCIPSWLSYFIGLSVAMHFVETALGYNVDFRNGLFGYEYTAGLFPLLLVIGVMQLYRLRHKYIAILASLVFIEIILYNCEAKAEMILLPLFFVTMLIIDVGISKKIVFRIFLVIIVLYILSLSWNYMIITTKFATSRIANQSIPEMLQIRIFDRSLKDRNSMLNMIGLSDNFFTKWFGNGAGISMPPTFSKWSTRWGFDLSEIIHVWPYTTLYGKYSIPDITQTLYTMQIDIGYNGIVLYSALIFSFAVNSIKLMNRFKGTSSKYFMLGSVGLWQVFTLIHRSIDGNITMVPLAIATTFLIYGMIKHSLKETSD